MTLRPTPPGADHRDRAAEFDLGGAQRRSDAGGDAAADQRRLVERNVIVHRHDGVFRDDAALSHRAQPRHVVNAHVAFVEARRIVEHEAAPAREMRGAQGRPPTGAVFARAAGRNKRKHHAVAFAEARHTRTNRLDHPGAFMAEHLGQRVRNDAANHRKIAVADAARLDAQQHFALFRRVKLDLFDDDGGVAFVADGGERFHQ